MGARKKTPVAAEKTPVAAAVIQEIVAKHVSTACSVEFGRDTKGQPKWNLKLSCEREEMEDAVEEVMDLDQKIQDRLAGDDE